MSDDRLKFPDTFHFRAGIGQRSGNAYFGTDVLTGLVTGMDDFLTDPDGRWSQYRSLGPAVLGCVPWLDDPALLTAIDRFPSACVVVTKQGLKKRGREKCERLKQYAQQGNGFSADVFAEMTESVSPCDGQPPEPGPRTVARVNQNGPQVPPFEQAAADPFLKAISRVRDRVLRLAEDFATQNHIQDRHQQGIMACPPHGQPRPTRHLAARSCHVTRFLTPGAERPSAPRGSRRWITR